MSKSSDSGIADLICMAAVVNPMIALHTDVLVPPNGNHISGILGIPSPSQGQLQQYYIILILILINRKRTRSGSNGRWLAILPPTPALLVFSTQHPPPPTQRAFWKGKAMISSSSFLCYITISSLPSSSLWTEQRPLFPLPRSLLVFVDQIMFLGTHVGEDSRWKMGNYSARSGRLWKIHYFIHENVDPSIQFLPLYWLWDG